MTRIVLAAIAALFLMGASGAQVERGAPIPFSAAEVFFEINATDGDAGIQVFFDAEGWKDVKIFDPDGKVFMVKVKKSLKEIGLTELRFESEEPGFDEMPLDEFLALFPPGTYRFVGKTVDGERLEGAATLTHAIPDAATILAPAMDEVLPEENVVIRWNGVANPPGSQIVGYEVIVEREDPLRTFTVLLPASARAVTVPEEFLEPGTDYKFEIIAIETSGNKTIVESTFSTAG